MSLRIGVPWLARLPVDHVGGVRVGVEVDDSDLSPPARLGDRGRRRPGDRVVAAEDDREDAPICDLGHALADRPVRELDHAVGADGVAVVDDLQRVEQLDPEIEVERPRVVGERP